MNGKQGEGFNKVVANALTSLAGLTGPTIENVIKASSKMRVRKFEISFDV